MTGIRPDAGRSADGVDSGPAYHVVVNDEAQYSIWPVDDPVPGGWRTDAFTGGYQACLDHIDEVWTDMRPLSLRRWMAEYASQDHADPPPPLAEDESLVTRLSAGSHPVEVEPRNLERLREALHRRRFLVCFTGTAGGTRLAVQLDPAASDLTALDRGAGLLRLVGELTLDGSPVVCTATVRLPELVGDGQLGPIGSGGGQRRRSRGTDVSAAHVSREPAPARGSMPVDQGHEVEPSGGFTASQRVLRGQLCALLTDPGVQSELAGLDNEDDIAAGLSWRLYRELGSRGWLAPHWPARYGGLDLSWAEAAVVAEELALHGVADTAIVNGIYNVGECLLAVGTSEQRQRYLPGLASGELVATVLLTEPEAGSDLAALATVASAHDGGWMLTGSKVWTAQSQRADVALCAARTGPGSGYAGVSLFLVPMRAAGVRVSRLDTVNVEALYTVDLDGLRLPTDSLVGTVGDGWSVLVDALVLERAGLGYQGRARRWLNALSGWIDEHPDAVDPLAAQLVAMMRVRVRAGRELAWHVVRQLVAGGPSAAATAAAMAKWYNTRAGTDVTVLAQAIGADLDMRGRRDDQPGDLLAAAGREAMGLALAAGTSEMMLTIVQSDLHRLLAMSS